MRMATLTELPVRSAETSRTNDREKFSQAVGIRNGNENRDVVYSFILSSDLPLDGQLLRTGLGPAGISHHAYPFECRDVHLFIFGRQYSAGRQPADYWSNDKDSHIDAELLPFIQASWSQHELHGLFTLWCWQLPWNCNWRGSVSIPFGAAGPNVQNFRERYRRSGDESEGIRHMATENSFGLQLEDCAFGGAIRSNEARQSRNTSMGIQARTWLFASFWTLDSRCIRRGLVFHREYEVLFEQSIFLRYERSEGKSRRLLRGTPQL